MSRKTEPARIVQSLPYTSAEHALMDGSLRPLGGTPPDVTPGRGPGLGWLWGTNPCVTCERCELRYDASEAGCCPMCMAWYARCEQEYWAAHTLGAMSLNIKSKVSH